MRATVTYNEDGEVSSFIVKYDRMDKLRGKMEGSTAVITSMKPQTGEDRVYADNVRAAWGYLESLPFVQAVVLQNMEADDE